MHPAIKFQRRIAEIGSQKLAIRRRQNGRTISIADVVRLSALNAQIDRIIADDFAAEFRRVGDRRVATVDRLARWQRKRIA